MPSKAPGDVVGFYDTHPINEQQILDKLAAAGVALDGLTQSELEPYDQDHYGAVEALECIAGRLGLGPDDHVLDVCSGMGGPARSLAHRHGCRVTGLDLTLSRHQGAERLTALVGLSHLVTFRHGDAQRMPFRDDTFDAVIGQEAWAHVPDRRRLIHECARVVRPGGRIGFTDILRHSGRDAKAIEKWRSGLAMASPASAGDYLGWLDEAGFVDVAHEDVSAAWAGDLTGRLEMFRSLESQTVASFGRARFEQWDEAYVHFVSLIEGGVLGGGRFTGARR